MGALRDNWRIAMLVVFLIASGIALFGPIGPGGATTTTELQTLAEDESTLTLERSSIVLENSTTLETTNESTNTITATDVTIEFDGDVTDVTNMSATLSNGTLTVSNGTIVTPANTSEITAGEREIAVQDATLRTENSRVTVPVERPVDTGPTNLQYGLDLSGGTRIRAPLVGLHVSDLDIDRNESTDLSRQLAGELGVDPIDVRIRQSTVEVFDGDVSKSEFATALQSAGYDVTADEVNDGVTSETRNNVVNVVQGKIDRTGLSGGTVTTAGEGDRLVVVEVPNVEPDQVRDIVTDRGVVRIVAEVREPGSNTTTNRTVITGDDIARTGQIRPRRGTNGEVWEVPVTLEDAAAESFQDDMNELGFANPSGTYCARSQPTGGDQSAVESRCLLTTLDGEIIQSNGVAGSLGQDFQDRTFTERPTFTIGASNASEAQNVKISLDVGSLPTNLDLSEGAQYDVSYILPSYAQSFKGLSVLTGLLAWFAVAGMVFLRYKKARVAIPMLFTAIAEVFILLGFAAVSGLTLDLSHIAGLIAVIGTGVDDLVIIADEILQQGEVATGRVFQNRFRKAFWVIGAAAVTTIIAMSPLTILSVGDLFGFAIVTIVGVLIGVLITR
ncbi:MAG: hypothetical protein V5A27_12325, partial [Halapricum sp.]